MFGITKSKKELLQQIEDLEEALAVEKQKTQYIEDGQLAQCKNVFCHECEHAVVFDSLKYGKRLVGCDVSVKCPDYKRKSPDNRQD